MPGLKHHIIGVCGFASAGKDTVADLLVTHAGFRKMAYANALRSEVVDAFHVEPMIFTRREFKDRPLQELALSRSTTTGYVGAALKHLAEAELTVLASEQLARPRSPRWTLQQWGTQFRRAEDEDYWTRQVRDSIRFYMHECHEHNFVVTDVRFSNEADTIRRLGGQIWQVRRPGVDASTSQEGEHASRNDGSEFEPDVVISNAHDIRHLQQLVLGEYWALDAGLKRVEVTIA